MGGDITSAFHFTFNELNEGQLFDFWTPTDVVTVGEPVQVSLIMKNLTPTLVIFQEIWTRMIFDKIYMKMHDFEVHPYHYSIFQEFPYQDFQKSVSKNGVSKLMRKSRCLIGQQIKSQLK